jgi:hypothetical protein
MGAHGRSMRYDTLSSVTVFLKLKKGGGLSRENEVEHICLC